MDSQSSSQTSQSAKSSSQFVMQSFSNPVSLKLDEENYLPWKDQAEATIEGHDLLHHITGKSIPKKFATQEDQENEVVSVEYQNWKKARRIVEILVAIINEQAIYHTNGRM